jgi:ketosteroid isomerase-like protein
MKSFVLMVAVIVATSTSVFAQNTNSSTTERPRTTTTNVNRSKPPISTAAPAPQKAPPSTESAPKTTAAKKPATTKQPAAADSGSDAVLAAFNTLLDGIREANVDAVTGVYWNSPRLNLFNYNGTVTKGWEQMRKNRESSYPEMKDVKLDVKDVSVTMLGRDGAMVSCLWTQAQTYKGAPETVSGRMTLVFKRIGTAWKAIHLHSSSDTPNPVVVPPSEQIPKPQGSPIP